MFVKPFLLFFGIIIQCIVILFAIPLKSDAQEVKVENVEKPSIKINRIAIVDLDGVLRAADANNRVRELLDGQKVKFQEEFRSVEIDLQESERDLATKRENMNKEEYEKLVNAFQARVSNVQKEIQYKRQSIDRAYQKALSDIR